MTKVTRFTLDNGAGLERSRLNLHEGSEDGGSPAETVGLELRKARLHRGEEIAHVSVVLKIRKAYLNALEESKFEELPGHTYAIGFVRSYAGYLGLDAAHLVGRLKRELGSPHEIRESMDAVSASGERTMPQGGMIFGVLLAIAAIVGIYYLFSAVENMSARPVPPVPAGLAAEAGLPSAVPSPSQTAELVPAPPPVVETVSAPPAPSAAAPLPPGRKFGAGNANSRLTLVVHRSARVIVRGPTELVFINRVLEPGDTYQVPNMAGLKLFSDDAGAVEIILNGNSIGFAGKDGVAAEAVSLGPQDMLDRTQG